MPQEPVDKRLDSLEYSLARYAEVTPRFAFPARADAAGLAFWAEQARGKLAELIGPFPRERIALEAEFGEPVRRPGYSRQTVRFHTRDNLDAFGYMLVPDGLRGRAPAVVCLPGHGRGVDDIVGIKEDGTEREHPDGYQHDFAVQCVRHGYVTLALELLGFGHRRDAAARQRGAESSSCQPAAGAALLIGETMAGWRVWDVMRALDLLETRPEVDPERLALMGISGGGTVSLYAAALDPRVKAAVLSCSFCTLRDSIFSISHCIDNYVPGLLRTFEAADIVSLIAPRALFAENGTQDDIFPKAGVEAAIQAARRNYEALGAGDQLGHAFFEGGHQFDGAAAFRALERWLKP